MTTAAVIWKKEGMMGTFMENWMEVTSWGLMGRWEDVEKIHFAFVLGAGWNAEAVL